MYYCVNISDMYECVACVYYCVNISDICMSVLHVWYSVNISDIMYECVANVLLCKYK